MKIPKEISVFGVLAVLGGIVGYFYAKQEAARAVLENIKLKIKKIDGIKYDFRTLSFRVKLGLKNPTGYDFSSLDNLTVKRLRIYDQHRNLLANANINASNIVFPPNGEYVLPPTRLVVEMGLLGNLVLENTGNLSNLPDQLIYEVDVEIFGYEDTITIN